MEMEATFTRAPITEGATRVPEQVSGQVFTPNLVCPPQTAER